MDSTTSNKEAPEARDTPLEAVPILRMPRLTREQLEAMFNESSSDEDEDSMPTSAASSRYRPTTPL